jgi:hypothetical protein
MIERPMPQDILKYQAKLIGNFSMRQCISILACVILIIAGYFLLGKNMKENHLTIIMSALPALPAFMIGFVPIMGLPMEKVAIPLLIDNFLAPAVRKKEIHFPDYEKYCKLNYDEKARLEEKIKIMKSLENGEEVPAENGKKKKEKRFKVTKSNEFKGIK